jgi:hypothetical protein
MSTGMELNKERLEEQTERNKALYDKNKAEEKTVWEPMTTRDPNEPNKPSEKGGYKRRRRRSTKRRRRATKKRRRTMRR